MKTSGRPVAIVFLVLGLAGLVVGGITFWNNYSFLGRAVSVDATVSGYKTSRSSKGAHRMSYAPVYSYTYGGKSYTVASNISSSSQAVAVGAHTSVKVDPGTPGDMREEGWKMWLLTMIFGGIGLLFTAVGAVVLRAARRRRAA